MRFQRQLKLLITSAADGSGKVLFDDNGDILYSTSSATFIALRNDGDMSVAASATEALPFGDVTTASAVLIETDTELDLLLNGGSEVIKVKPGPSGKGVLYLESEISQIQITNTSSTAAANVLYAVVGI